MPNALRRSSITLLFISVLLTACNFNPNPPTPTVESMPTEPPTSTLETILTPLASPSLTLPATAAVVRLASPTPSNSPEAPTEAPTETPTPGPYIHRVQAGEGLYGIIAQYGYTNSSVFAAILALNPNIPNENSLPVGQEIMIPRMTHTPTPPNYEATVALAGTLGIRLPDQFADNTRFECHNVVDNESMIDIADQYNTTIQILSSLNPEISFYNCDFNNRSGGPNCSPLIRPGQCVQVPLPTPTPTLSPTPSGNETATPTPTYDPPRVINPPNEAVVSGNILLRWVSVGILGTDEYYFVDVNNRTSGETFTQVTKDTSLRLPSEMLPPEGAQHEIEWRVTVVRGQGEDYVVIGGVMPARIFRWQRR